MINDPNQAMAASMAEVVRRLETLERRSDYTETWHMVGAAGEPAFQNSWANFAGGYQPLRFRKERGRVFIEGVIKSGGSNTICFTLPVGYRPSLSLQRPARVLNTIDHTGLHDVKPDGTVTVGNLTGTGTVTVSSFGYDFTID